jgi:hypothetical protein
MLVKFLFHQGNSGEFSMSQPIFEYLTQRAEAIPEWLGNFKQGSEFQHNQFFTSRVVYYPGSGLDGQPVKLFGSTHSAHCFVYVDYGIEQNTLKKKLQDAHENFLGYHTFARVQLSERDLSPNGWRSHIEVNYRPLHGRPHINITPFGFLEVLERDQNLDDNHGPCRLAIVFLGADGIAAYDALFCQNNGALPPFAVVLQDHGFGGNYDEFGQHGLLARIASDCRVIPELLLVAKNTQAWNGFALIQNLQGYAGGMHEHIRYLYERAN